MSKALMGTFTSPPAVQLLDEIRVLRDRVRELERALEEAEAARDERVRDAVLDEPTTVAT